MGTVFKKTVTKAMPAGAETFTREGQRFARWKDAAGKTRKARVTVGRDGADRITIEGSRYVAKYRDGDGIVRVVSTGCRDEKAARSVLADLERQAELVKANVITSTEAAISKHQDRPLSEHFDAYLASLESAGACQQHRTERKRQLNRLAAECGFQRLAELERGKLEAWLTVQARNKMSARTRNSYLSSALAFCNWCVEATVKRLAMNPFEGIPKANEKADPRRQRRAMTEEELVKLLAVARERPLNEALTVRRGPKCGERYANVRDDVRALLDHRGQERALIYKTLVLSGLRKGELASLTISQLNLGERFPHAILNAADEKSREGNEIPLRDDLAADLREWLFRKLEQHQDAARMKGEPIPVCLPAETRLFDVPEKLCKILNRDLKQAGIAKRDDRGRVLDVHALRHTFGTLMSKGGVSPRVTQCAMRHSKIELTMGVYTDPRLLDIRGALDVLPALPLNEGDANRQAALATGTDEKGQYMATKFAPAFAPTRCKPGQKLSQAVNSAGDGETNEQAVEVAVSGDLVKRKEPLTTRVNGSDEMGVIGLEPMTPSVSSWCSSQLS
jgi:integrase